MLKHIAEFSAQTESGELTPEQAEDVLDRMLEGLPKAGRILLVPPDITRCFTAQPVVVLVNISPFGGQKVAAGRVRN